MRHLVHTALVGALALLVSCDAATKSEPTAATAPAAKAPADATKTPAPTDSASKAPAPAPTVAAAPDCAAVAKHVHAVITATGSARAKEYLRPIEESEKDCAGKTNDPELMRCFIAATDTAGFDACNRKPFEREIDGKPTRSFSALKDNSKVSPAVLSQDGDYLAYDDDCGMLYKEVAPAGAIFIACKGKVQIGPLVNMDEIDSVTKKLAADEKRRHEIVMNMIAALPSGDFTVPVHVYNADGSYKGIERR